MKNKNCELDQIRTLTVKEVITVCLPTITHIVNMSLTRGDFTIDWKLAIVRPLLKNLALNSTQELQTCLKLILPLKLVEQCML